MQRQQSFQQELLKTLAQPDAQQQAVQAAQQAQGAQAAQAFTQGAPVVQPAPVSDINMSVAQPASLYDQLMQDYLMRGGN